MGCNRLKDNNGNVIGFICDMSNYIKAEEEWWQKHLPEYKEAFINHFLSMKIDEDVALIEYEAHLENVGIDNLSTPEQDAEDCMSYWDDE